MFNDDALARATAHAVALMRDDVRDGILPAGLSTLTEAHDYVDACEYADRGLASVADDWDVDDAARVDARIAAAIADGLTA